MLGSSVVALSVNTIATELGYSKGAYCAYVVGCSLFGLFVASTAFTMSSSSIIIIVILYQNKKLKLSITITLYRTSIFILHTLMVKEFGHSRILWQKINLKMKRDGFTLN